MAGLGGRRALGRALRWALGRALSRALSRALGVAPQVKSVKPCLKQLQQCIQTISTLHDDEILPSNPADLFHWLPKEHMCVLVYLVSAGPREGARRAGAR